MSKHDRHRRRGRGRGHSRRHWRPELTEKEGKIEALGAGPERSELEAAEAAAVLEAGPDRSQLEAGVVSEAIGGRGPRTLRDEAALELNRLTRMTTRLRRRGHGSEGRDSASGQGRVLKLLGMNPRMTQRDLTYILDVSRQSMAETLAKLEEQGLVDRKQAVEDRRVTVVELTEEGRLRATEMEKQTDIIESVLDDFTDLEISQLTEFLARINTSLRAKAEDGRREGRGRNGSRRRGGRRDHGRRHDHNGRGRGSHRGRAGRDGRGGRGRR